MIDARIGGNIYSATTANLYKAGNAAGTVINGTRGEFVVPNSVTSDGNGGYTANSNAVTPELYWGRAAGGNIGVGEAFYMMLLIFVYVILPLVMILRKNG